VYSGCRGEMRLVARRSCVDQRTGVHQSGDRHKLFCSQFLIQVAIYFDLPMEPGSIGLIKKHVVYHCIAAWHIITHFHIIVPWILIPVIFAFQIPILEPIVFDLASVQVSNVSMPCSVEGKEVLVTVQATMKNWNLAPPINYTNFNTKRHARKPNQLSFSNYSFASGARDT